MNETIEGMNDARDETEARGFGGRGVVRLETLTGKNRDAELFECESDNLLSLPWSQEELRQIADPGLASNVGDVGGNHEAGALPNFGSQHPLLDDDTFLPTCTFRDASNLLHTFPSTVIAGDNSAIGGLSPIRRRNSLEDDGAMDFQLRHSAVTIPTRLADDENVLQYFHSSNATHADEDFLPTYQPRFSLLFTTIAEEDEELDSDDSTPQSHEQQKQQLLQQHFATDNQQANIVNEAGPSLQFKELIIAMPTAGTNAKSPFLEKLAEPDFELQDPLVEVDTCDTSSALHDDSTLKTTESDLAMRSEHVLPTSEELGASSMAFIQHLRGAAFRRKMNLSRSRDSLAAKERKHLEEVAASEREASQDVALDLPEEISETQKRKLASSDQGSNDLFKARPLPSTNGILGSGGMMGVPKVEKRPATTPVSPKLGQRRHQLTDSPIQEQFRPTYVARPIAYGNAAHGGMVGVPKVEKRPTTTPISPCLGPRRNLRKSEDATLDGMASNQSLCDTLSVRLRSGALGRHGGLVGVPKVEKRPVTVPLSPCLGSRRGLRQQTNPGSDDQPVSVKVAQSQASLVFKALPVPKSIGFSGGAGQAGVPKVSKRQATVPQSPLLGARRAKTESVRKFKIRRRFSLSSLSFAVSKPSIQLNVDDESSKENDVAVSAHPNAMASALAYIPRSTERAAKRAEFEVQRRVLEQQRKDNERKEREINVAELRGRLGKLRMSI